VYETYILPVHPAALLAVSRLRALRWAAAEGDFKRAGALPAAAEPVNRSLDVLGNSSSRCPSAAISPAVRQAS
jgi:hypothetical protein